MEFSLTLPGRVRPGAVADLAALSWFGSQDAYLPSLRELCARCAAGDSLFWVAELGGFPVGRVSADLRREEGHGEIWGLVVMPHLQGAGLGTRLLDAAEAALGARGLFAVLTVGKANTRAVALYQRRGYTTRGEAHSEGLITPEGRVIHEPEPVWVMEKRGRGEFSRG